MSEVECDREGEWLPASLFQDAADGRKVHVEKALRGPHFAVGGVSAVRRDGTWVEKPLGGGGGYFQPPGPHYRRPPDELDEVPRT